MQRLLSYGILSLITSTPIAGGSPTPGLGEDEEEEGTSRFRQGVTNDEGTWCWREECEGSFTSSSLYTMPDGVLLDCLKLTKALQKTADILQSVADLHDDNV